MRKFTVVLSLLLAVAVLIPVLSLAAQPSHTPHENPATAGGSSSSLLLLIFHGDIYEVALGGRYQDAQDLLDKIKHANISDELKYIVDRFDALSHELFSDLDNLENLLDEISVLLEQYQMEEAQQQLEYARTVLENVDRMLDDGEMAVDAIGRRLYIGSYAPTSQLRQAYDRLKGILEQMRLLYRDFDARLGRLFLEYEDRVAVELIPTYLTIEATPESVFVGDSIVISGQLSSEDGPLADRSVTVLFEEKPEVVSTDEGGSYSTTIDIPYRYVTSVVFVARYTPAGDDIGVYGACESPRLTVDVSYYRTYLELSAPEVAYPGLPITVTGEISTTGDSIERNISLLLDNINLATVQARDRLEEELVIPDETVTGNHTLTASISAQQRYAGVSESLTIQISQFPLQVDVQAPSLILLPGEVNITGRVWHDSGPLGDAAVRVSFGESSSTQVITDADGNFEAVLEAPLRLSLVGPKRLMVGVEPVEPYYSSAAVEKWIVVINPVGISLTLLAFVSAGFVVYRRVTKWSTRIRAETPAGRPDLPWPTPLAPSPEPESGSGLTGIRSEILTAYLEGRRAIEKATGIHIEPYITLREFLKVVVTNVTAAVGQRFTELTRMAEVTLYSAREPDEGMAADARQQAADIKKEFNRDTA
ncbi:MAG TPA: hypothetical protein G4O18_05060 [Dehalococcoidia bacterium]|nr:hypothetical protein [Dehalococcoidia bacterium]